MRGERVGADDDVLNVADRGVEVPQNRLTARRDADHDTTYYVSRTNTADGNPEAEGGVTGWPLA